MPNIKIYSTPTCPWCKKAKAFFEEKGLGYEDLNVAEDANAGKEMIEKSGQMGVPVIEIDGKIVVGFEIDKINEILALK